MTLTRTVTCDGCGETVDPRRPVGWYEDTPPGWTVATRLVREGLRPAPRHYCPPCWTAMQGALPRGEAV